MRATMQLGGNPTRLETTVEVLRQETYWRVSEYNDMMVIFATPENPIECSTAMLELPVPFTNVVFDFRGWDTLTHFLTLRKDLERWGITELIIVTDKGHLQRSLLLAKIVLLFSGITITGIPHESTYKDPIKRVIVDVFRAIYWQCTRIHLYNPQIKKARMPIIEGYRNQYFKMIPLTNTI